jgi:hypothetical protein
VKAARQTWFDGQDDLDPERLIFIDERYPSGGGRLVVTEKIAMLRS